MHLLRVFRASIMIPVVLGPMFLINFFQLLTLLVWPFSPAIFRASNRFLAGTWFKILSFSVERILGVEVRQTGDILPYGENVVLFANHQSMADVPILVI